MLSWDGLLALRVFLETKKSFKNTFLWMNRSCHSPAGLGLCLQPPQAEHRDTESFNQSGLGRCSEVTGAESLPALDTGSLWLQATKLGWDTESPLQN